ncbi:EF HAND 1 calcium binding site [Echinococcus multilocularis]|uniref:EF HAND 1 calcium binding site n=1 Tax=Echinococcus multilocularis TaxID=6211 RepID=A0A087VY96_ECHMU|nr:EF HAND 1 calcium binding site [Echinococcus multilocularis]
MGNKHTSLDRETLDMLQKKTKMSPKELKDWYKRFRKQFPDGQMSRSEFAHVYSDFFPGGHSDAFADIVFNNFDTNGDGAVNFTEFTCALGIINNGSVDEKINWAFDLYDQDKNGVISLSELTTMLKALYKLVGVLDTSQLPPGHLTPEQHAAAIFEKLDVNKDGTLSREEFIRGTSGDQNALQFTEVFLCPRHFVITCKTPNLVCDTSMTITGLNYSTPLSPLT